MKFQVGEKVTYNNGEWLFYGVITAVIDNSLCPCYRIRVERMEKENCKFSITQFEFELEADKKSDSDQFMRKLENYHAALIQKKEVDRPTEIPSTLVFPETEQEQEPELLLESEPEPEQEPVFKPEKKLRKKRETTLGKIEFSHAQPIEALKIDSPKEKKPKEKIPKEKKPKEKKPREKKPKVEKPKAEKAKRRVSESWYNQLERFKEGVKDFAINNWVGDNRRQYKSGNLHEEKLEKLKEINFPFEVIRKKTKAVKEEIPKKPIIAISDPWERNYQAFIKGERNNDVFAWISQNRRYYKAGKLKDEHYEKLMEINFPFEIAKKTSNNWERQYELWKNGERNSLQQWRQWSVKQYINGKLSKDRIIKLKELGILK